MEAQLLGKYSVVYYQCNACQFIQTEEPYWLDEAYSSAIASLDIGLIQRNEVSAGIVQSVIAKWFDVKGRFVDYGGGYGMLVRMMRDRGFNFERYDMHCENLFAQTFEASHPVDGQLPYTLLTAFEVFEHLVEPKNDFALMLSYSRNILFSTELQPLNWVPKLDTWWYVLPETGQHISFYTAKSLHVIAEQQNLHYVHGQNNMHLLSEQPVNGKWFNGLTNWRGSQLYNQVTRNRQPSLLNSDFARLRNRKEDSNSFIKSNDAR
ncbi:class I SAM-dependent methyltransferase [Fibrella sp. HMF5335]|uniref:Class I SAM-dependent methyltransferase n=1 Tax=Fibrella rubiginis TaxID=2817060 RepID=A0A939K280_9BACT|nr:class I SAM-dependent methyltransferase [Fibrella rubiginis]MBO0937942.1 class I SAM-dependent methyltransferase [Fibrella rubiginis]